MPKGIRGAVKAACHPNRDVEGFGLCKSCYLSQYRDIHSAKTQVRTRVNIELPKGFYTYLWLRDFGTPYYVGKGKGNRAYIQHGHIVPPPQDSELIIIQEFETEEDAFFAEKFLIVVYGREGVGTGCLLNLTEGGEGASGYKQSEETRLKKSVSLKGKTLGRKHKTETLAKMREARKGRKLSEEHRKHLGESHAGFRHSESTKEKMRQAALGRKMSDSARKKMREAKLGKAPWNKGLKTAK